MKAAPPPSVTLGATTKGAIQIEIVVYDKDNRKIQEHVFLMPPERAKALAADVLSVDIPIEHTPTPSRQSGGN